MGFEPTDVGNTSPVFKTGSINRSDTSPNISMRRAFRRDWRRETSSDCGRVYHSSGGFVNLYSAKIPKTFYVGRGKVPESRRLRPLE